MKPGDSSTPIEFKPFEKEPVLDGQSAGGNRGTPSGGSPLQKFKGGKPDVKADSLTPKEFGAKEATLQGQPSSQKSSGDSCQNLVMTGSKHFHVNLPEQQKFLLVYTFGRRKMAESNRRLTANYGLVPGITFQR